MNQSQCQGARALVCLLLAGLAVTVLCGCSNHGSPQPRGTRPTETRAIDKSQPAPPLPEHVAKAFRPAMDLLQSASVIEGYRIEPTRGNDLSRGIVGYPILSRSEVLNPETSRQLQALVLDPRGYNGALWCGKIQPGVAFRFVGKGQVFTILICFKCDEWEFWLDGERIGSDWFVGVQPELLQLVQRVFPADDILRAIPSSESYGRIYRFESSRAGEPALSEVQREQMIGEWQKKVMDAVGEHAEWLYNGGNKYSLRMTNDNTAMIVITSKKGHAAIAALTGVKEQH